MADFRRGGELFDPDGDTGLHLAERAQKGVLAGVGVDAGWRRLLHALKLGQLRLSCKRRFGGEAAKEQRGEPQPGEFNHRFHGFTQMGHESELFF